MVDREKNILEERQKVIKKRSHFKTYIILGYALVLAVWGYFFSYSNITENLNAKKIIGASGLILFIIPPFLIAFVRRYLNTCEKSDFYNLLIGKFDDVEPLKSSILLKPQEIEMGTYFFGFHIKKYNCTINLRRCLTSKFNIIESFMYYKYYLNDESRLFDERAHEKVKSLRKTKNIDITVEPDVLIIRKNIVENGYCELDMMDDIGDIELFYREIVEPIVRESDLNAEIIKENRVQPVNKRNAKASIFETVLDVIKYLLLYLKETIISTLSIFLISIIIVILSNHMEYTAINSAIRAVGLFIVIIITLRHVISKLVK